MNTLAERILPLFDQLLQTSLQATVLVVLILAIQAIFRARLSPTWRYALWLLLVARLLLPASIPSPLSVFNVTRLFSAPAAADNQPPPPAPPTSSFAESPAAGIDNPNAVAGALHDYTNPLAASHRSVVDQIAPTPASETAMSMPDHRQTQSNAREGALDWRRIASGLWLTITLVLGLRLLWMNLRFRASLRHLTPMKDPRIVGPLEEARAALRLRRPVQVVETDLVAAPAVHGLWTKTLLLPPDFANRFSGSELLHVFLHELAHLKRRDLEINALVNLLSILHWFNPALWFAFRRMRADRELATDALALSCVRERESTPYGETILKVLEGMTRVPAAAGLVGIVENRTQMQRRLRAIAQYGGQRSWTWIAITAAVVIAACGLTDASPNGTPQENPSTGIEAALASNTALRDEPRAAVSTERSFTLRTVDFDTGQPIPGVPVEFTLDHYGGNRDQRVVSTDAAGHARLEFNTANLKNFTYHTADSRFLAIKGEWKMQQIAQQPEGLDIKLSPGIEIGGTVVNEAGDPVPGVEILVDKSVDLVMETRANAHSIIRRLEAGTRLAVTDANGLWSARCIWPTSTWCMLRIRHAAYADATYSTRITRAMEAEGTGRSLNFEDLTSQSARFVLEPGITVRGRVLANGVGKAGVPVRYGDLNEESHRIEEPVWERTVLTDPDGRFAIPHLPPQRQYITLVAPGYIPVTRSVDASEQVPDLLVDLESGPGLEARLGDADGNPIRGARIRFLDWSIWRGIHWETISDENGRFAWPDAPVEKFRVQIEKEGFITQSTILQGMTGVQELSMKPNLKIVGRVLNATTSQPIERFNISWAGGLSYLEQRATGIATGSNGAYTLDLGQQHDDIWSGGYSHTFAFRVEAEGHASRTSREFSARNGDVGLVTYDIELDPVDVFAGRVVDDQGRPVAGAQVALKSSTSRLRLAGRPQFENPNGIEFPVTDEAGRFQLSRKPDASHLVAVHELGIAWLAAATAPSEPTLQLQPWGRIEGTVWDYDQPLPDQEIWHDSSLLAGNPPMSEFVSMRGRSDSQGHFSFAYVPPGDHRLYRMIPLGRGSSSGPAEQVEVRPGETANVKIGGLGRPVLGKFRIANPYVEIDWGNGSFRVGSVRPQPPKELRTREEFVAWQEQPEIKKAFAAIRNHPLKMAEDGSFRIENVIPGRYQFSVQILDPRDPDAFAYSRHVATYTEIFEVPDSPQRDSREPLDLGEFEIALKPRVELGKTAAPAFTLPNLDGTEFSLSDLKGKYVLLDFWATWCAPCIAELPYLRAVQEKFGGRDDFVLVGLSMDDDADKPRDFVAANNMPWQQGFLGKRGGTNTVARAYGVEGIPAKILIDPEGRIIAKDLAGVSLVRELDKWLK